MTKPIDPTGEGTIHRLSDRRPGTGGKTGSNGATASGASRAPGRGEGVPRLTELEQEMTATPEFDADRVAGLRQAVSSGRYQVNSGSIAEKLLAMEAQLP